MISFSRFVEIVEGGNVVIDNQEAERIDLRKINRTNAVSVLSRTIRQIDKEYEKATGLPLWGDELLKSKEFLSGSAFHFFDLDNIEDETFKSVKSSVGDIDTQVDGRQEEMIKSFLDSMKGKKIEDLTLIGYKQSAGQFISLWKSEEFKFNIQIDLEMVDFVSGKPTPWSQFSHSSDWEDLKIGIKGVAHKYLMRALDAPKLKEVLIKAKSSRGKDKIIKSSDTAFSVTHGMRTKMVPVLDSAGKPSFEGNIPVYKELSTEESPGVTDLERIFQGYFGSQPTSQELKLMGSFVGLTELIKKKLPKDSHDKIVDGFAHTLWSNSAQGLYRGNKRKDFAEKRIMMEKLIERIGGDIKKFIPMIKAYYKVYK